MVLPSLFHRSVARRGFRFLSVHPLILETKAQSVDQSLPHRVEHELGSARRCAAVREPPPANPSLKASNVVLRSILAVSVLLTFSYASRSPVI
jgi:hypothetical protein